MASPNKLPLDWKSDIIIKLHSILIHVLKKSLIPSVENGMDNIAETNDNNNEELISDCFYLLC